jgi:hypothetical protein
MRKYGNANHEKQIDDDGTTVVSKKPITKKMEKAAGQDKGGKDQEVININDRLRD